MIFKWFDLTYVNSHLRKNNSTELREMTPSIFLNTRSRDLGLLVWYNLDNLHDTMI